MCDNFGNCWRYEHLFVYNIIWYTVLCIIFIRAVPLPLYFFKFPLPLFFGQNIHSHSFLSQKSHSYSIFEQKSYSKKNTYTIVYNDV